MTFLERNGIIHRDVAARNVLVGDVPRDVKLAIRNLYNGSAVAKILPLTDVRNPHDDFWDKAHTLKDRNGFMPFYFIFELRSADEIVSSNGNFAKDLGDLVKISSHSILAIAGRLTTIEDCRRRITIYFTLCHFLNGLPIEVDLH